ncbi:MAG: HXXEE domain-containing protein [Bacteroidetes bacterium]|nr:HXXEE domain-containing protein [Bacteroidota bacterium]
MNIQKVNRFWQSANLFIAPVLLVILIYFRSSMTFYQFLLWLHLPFLMIHEIEEYVLSPISFKEFFNLKTSFGSRTDRNYPLDEGYVFQVNIIIAWPMVIIGAILANIAPWVGFSMMLFELSINNLMHTLIFQPDKPTYNPGLITNSVLLLPLGAVTFLTALPFFQWYDWVLSLAASAVIVGLLAYKTTSRKGKLKRQ